MNIHGQEFEFQPALHLTPGICIEVHAQMPSGRACVHVTCAITHALIEDRPDCQVIEDGEKQIIVAMPGSIKRTKLSWKIRLLRWLAKG
jgi:hypothetical protein